MKDLLKLAEQKYKDLITEIQIYKELLYYIVPDMNKDGGKSPNALCLTSEFFEDIDEYIKKFKKNNATSTTEVKVFLSNLIKDKRRQYD